MTGTAIKLKICGMRDRANIERVAEIAPDYMGFIFYEKSPRFVAETFDVTAVLQPSITGVGVFVNESAESILQTLARSGLNWVQLHGDEKPEVAHKLKDEGITVIKVFSVDDEFDFSVTRPYLNYADYFLFDTRGKLFGGNAQRWNRTKKNENDTPA